MELKTIDVVIQRWKNLTGKKAVLKFMNEQNLKPGEYKLSREEAKKGGVASGKARRKKKDLRTALEILLDNKYVDPKSGKKMSGTELISSKLFQQALKGNIKAFETIRSTVGQDPVQKVMVAEVEQTVIDEVEELVSGDDQGTGG